MTWEVFATFTVFGYTTRPINLTPALGVGLIAAVFLLLLKTGGL